MRILILICLLLLTNLTSLFSQCLAPPVITVQPSDVAICSGSATATITLTVTGADSYQWFWSGSGAPNKALPNASPPWYGFTTNTLSVSPASSGYGQYWVTATNSCGSTTSNTVTVSNGIMITPSNNGPVCSGKPLNLMGPSGMTSYSWAGPNGFTSTSQNPTVSPAAIPVLSGVYTLNVITSTGCPGSGSTTVIVNPATSFTISSNSPVALGAAIKLKGPSGMTSYAWTGPNGFTSTSQSSTVSTIATAAMFGTYSLTATGSNGCGNTASIVVANSVLLNQPEVAKGNHAVDLVTGTLSVNVPLFSITDGDITVPLSVSYVGNGVKLNESDGWVGQNWSFSAQSYGVFRNMRSLPDDYLASGDTRKGWLNDTQGTSTAIKNFSPTTDNNATTCADEVSNYTFLNGLTYDKDAEPDEFHVSAPGLSFKFYFDENKVPRALPYQDVVITPVYVSGVITSFSIVDPKGITYVFSETESVTESLQAANSSYFARRSHLHLNPFTYNVSWRLTSIASPVYGTVSFSYKAISIPDNNPFYPGSFNYNRYKYRFPIDLNEGCGAAIFSLRYSRVSVIKALTKISSPSEEAVLVTGPKFSGAGATVEQLNSITINDKREGSSRTIKSLNFYFITQGSGTSSVRQLLDRITETVNISSRVLYSFAYRENLAATLPTYSSLDKDQWGFFKKNPIPYDETVTTSSLERIVNLNKGYTAFLYEPHDYWDGTTTIQGGGLRIRKIISYDGMATNSDIVDRYEYKNTNNQSSGKLQYNPQYSFWTPVIYCNKPVTSTEVLSNDDLFQGSAVAYERVTVSRTNGGSSVYEFDLPASYGDASANNNEWQASRVDLARPANATCYDAPNILLGINQYPFPPNSDYSFARGLLKKRTDLRDDGVTVKESTFTYQRIYAPGATAIRKIYGLALEEMVNAAGIKMFVYSKYALFADVKTAVKNQTETTYQSSDLLQKTVVSTDFYYESLNHAELTRVVTTNSDLTQSVTRLKYGKDYAISTPGDVQCTALKNMLTAHRTFTVVETLSSKIIAATEKYIGGTINFFQTLNGKVYPQKQYTFVSNDGTTGFVPSSIAGTTTNTFVYDQTNYVLTNTILSFDAYANPAEAVGRDRQISAVATGYMGTLPIIQFSNAALSEVRYSDFETPISISFGPSGTGTTGRNGSKSYSLPAYPTGAITTGININGAKNYIFSAWIKTTSAGSLTISIYGASVITTALPFTASSTWKYYSVVLPITAGVTSGSVQIKSSVAVELDDLAFYPDHADFKAFTYQIPYGISSSTDSRADSKFFSYDDWGRITVVYDRNKNVVTKYDYQVKP